jgi:D-amino-acid dehydrogenase
MTAANATHPVDIAVIGAGVVGMATAYACARRGASVALIEQEDAPALRTSFANGAQLSYAYTDAMATPALWGQLPGMLSGRDPAFRARPAFDPHFWLWGLRFLGNATEARLQHNTVTTLKLALASQRAMQDLLAKHPIAFQHSVAGKLHLYYNAASLPKARAMIDLKHAYGIRQQLLDADAAIAIEPALVGARGVAGAVYSPDEEAGDPWAFSVQLLDVLQQHYALQPYFGFHLTHMRRHGAHWHLTASTGKSIRAKQMVICAGIESHALLRTLGLSSPLMAVKGYSFTAPCGAAAPQVSITDTARKLVFCRLGDKIRVAGLADLNHWGNTPDPARLAHLIAMARESLPDAADYDAIESTWTGLRPVTPYSSPMIRLAGEGLVLNIGHGMLGWTLAMGSGERAARLLLEPSAAT